MGSSSLLMERLPLVKLWENSSPTSDFSSGNVSFSATKYDFFLIFYKRAKASGSEVLSIIARKNELTALQSVYVEYKSSTSYWDYILSLRDVTIINTGASFSNNDTSSYGYSGTGHPTSHRNDNNIPIAIYGILT